MDLIVGNTYKRTDIHESYGGSRYSGISPLKDGSRVFIFSNHAGETHGYQDGWENSYYLYTGAGQTGDQDVESKKHNGHILNHAENGSQVSLFIGASSGFYTYAGDMSLVDYEYFETHDKNGKNRRAVRFVFERSGGKNDSVLATRAPAKPYRKPDTTSRKGLVTTRVGQGYYRQSILERFNSVCAVLGVGPVEILVASHIVPWRSATDEERLDVENGILLSPLLDALFDKHLISFDDYGRIIFSPKVSDEMRGCYGLSGHEQIKVTVGMLTYLERHRRELRH
jgi:predicted restriction endonuclease